MRFFTGVRIAAFFLGGIDASPCKPSQPISSTANTATSVSSSKIPVTTSSYLISSPLPSATISISESSSVVETISTTSTQSDSISSVESSSSSSSDTASTSSLESTSTVSDEPTSTSSVEVTSTSSADATSTVSDEPTSTSSVEVTSTNSAEITSTSSAATSSETSEVISTTISDISTSTIEASSTISTDATSSSTSSSSTASDEPSSTSTLGPIVTTFTLQSANSGNSAANNQVVKYKPNSDVILYLATSRTGWVAGTFSLESGTNRLMVDNLYIITNQYNGIYAVQSSSNSYYSYITCSSPVRSGSALSCQAEDGVRTQLAVSNAATTNINLVILPATNTDTTYSRIDLIAN